jgi:PST family polysaccharide transporter
MSASITKQAFSALRWNYVGFFVRSGSNFLFGILLARLLGPKPFGQLAAAMFVVGIANLIADGGFVSAIIQAPEITSLQIRYVFTIQMLSAIAMTAACGSVAGFIANAFHDPAVRLVLLGISPLFVLQALGQTANALLRRALAFRTLQILQISSYLVSYLLLALPLAFLGYGVWSLVFAQLLQASIYSALLYARLRHPVSPSLDSSGVALLHFGAKTTASNVVNYGISNFDNFVVGHVFGSISLGLYNRGFTLASAPTDGLVGTLQQVLFAGCSRAGGRMDPLRRAYLASLASMAFVVMPIFWAMAAASSTVMIGLYGKQWMPAVPLFRPLALALSAHALMCMAGPVLSSLNLVQREIQAQTLTLLVAIAAFSAAAHVSIVALAWTVLGSYVFRFAAMTYAVLLTLDLRWADVLRVLAGPAALGLLTAAVVWGVDKGLREDGFRPSVALIGLLTAGLLTVLAVLAVGGGRWLFAAEFTSFLRQAVGGLPPCFTARLLGSSTVPAPLPFPPVPINPEPSSGVSFDAKSLGEG